MRAYRIWGSKEKLYPSALKRIRTTQLNQAVQIAAGLDRQVKGLYAPELPADPWDGLRLLGRVLH